MSTGKATPGGIEQMWQRFSQTVVPKDASDVQRQEMHRCFFAGAAATFRLFEIASQIHAEEKAALFLEAVSEEVEAFGQQLDRDVFGSSSH